LLDRGQVCRLVRRDVGSGIVDTAKSEAGTIDFRPPRTAHDPRKFEPCAAPETVRELLRLASAAPVMSRRHLAHQTNFSRRAAT
jgi:hypothetical protein